MNSSWYTPYLLMTGILVLMSSFQIKDRNFDYEKAWSLAQKDIADGLPKSALSKIQEIYAFAIKENNVAQELKASVYEVELILQTEELGLETVVKNLLAKIESSNNPSKQLLQSNTAILFSNYFNNNYYKISQRTDLADFDTGDMRTWSASNYRDFIGNMFLESLKGKEIKIQKTIDFEAIVDNIEENNKELRPYLYDLLVDRAINHFSSNNMLGIQPSFKFKIDDAKYFAAANEFCSQAFETADESSMIFKALELYQEVLCYHIENEDYEALASYDEKRLMFVKNNAEIADLDQVYLSALRSAENYHIQWEAIQRFSFLIAQHYLEMDQLEKAIEKYELIIKTKENEEIALACKSAIDNIQRGQVNIQIEEIYTTADSISYHISSKNIKELHFKLIKIDDNELAAIQIDNRKKIAELKNRKSIKSWIIKGMHNGLRLQSQEEAIAPLDYGNYVLMSSENFISSGSLDHSVWGTVFLVSDMALTTVQGSVDDYMIVRNRIDGKPMKGVEVKLYQQRYNRSIRKSEQNLVSRLRTNDEGKVTVEGQDHQSLIVELKNGDDEQKKNDNFYKNRHSEYSKNGQVELFMDRAIYRPGQTVHFKGLAIGFNERNEPHIIEKSNVLVTLNDANGKQVHEIELSLNEFGSFSGSFTLPIGRLTGNFSISTEVDGEEESAYGSKYFRVEEYKRPKFEVTLLDNPNELKLGDTITVVGLAQALSGASVTDAKVVYTVKKGIRYSYWSRWYGSNNDETLVKQGELQTNEDGSFEFSFLAAKDNDIDLESNPKYYYTIEVNVTDQSGETRSANTNLQIAPLPYEYQWNLKNICDISELEKVEIKALNATGQNVESKAILVITELIEPEAWEKNKYWNNQPTRYFGRRYFPQQNHVDETLKNYKEGKEIYRKEINITKEAIEQNWANKLKAGSYKCHIESVNKYEGYAVKTTSYIAINDKKKKNFRPVELLYVDAKQSSYQVGDQIEYYLSTPEDNVMVFYQFVNGAKVLKSGWEKIGKLTKLSYNAKASDKGGISLLIDLVKHNRYLNKNINIEIPWDDKKLDIELVTYRDKMLPGSDEEWTLKIKGPKGDQLLKELLATMYDASLDQFVEHQYSFSPYPSHYSNISMNSTHFGLGQGFQLNRDMGYSNVNYPYKRVPSLINLRSISYNRGDIRMRGSRSVAKDYFMDGVQAMPMSVESEALAVGDAVTSNKLKSLPARSISSIVTTAAGISADNGDQGALINKPDIQPRKNLNETVFFYPHLKTDAEGNVLLSFRMNEALTTWKLLTFAHDEELRYGMSSQEVKTQKELMIVPNAPRFLREGDRLVFPAMVSNLSDKDINATAELSLINPADNTSLNALFGLTSISKNVLVAKGLSQRVDWEINIPKDYKGMVKYIVTVQGENHSDGEENILPVVTNRKLVTESQVMYVRAEESKVFNFGSMAGQTSTTATPHRYTFEYTSNPVWYAIQALPYIMEYPHQCAEQITNRLYANLMASKIANAHPRIQAVFDQWKATDSDALLSNLNKNEELKSAILEETPWVRNAQSETAQKKMIGVLFDLNRMSQEAERTKQDLVHRQNPDGSFSWFPGGRSNVYITQNVIESLIHLRHLGVLEQSDQDINNIIDRAIVYLDEQSKERYDNLLKTKANMSEDHLDYLSVHYLYLRSFIQGEKVLDKAQTAYDYYYGQAEKYWLNKNLYANAMIGLVMFRSDNKIYKNIQASLVERSFYSDELGRYWNLGNGYNWHELPIEAHALIIEFFTEVGQDRSFIEDMKIWLLKNKQTNHWATTKSTSAAIYALLLQGENNKMGINTWILETSTPVITIGGKVLDYDNESPELGTGYIKKSYNADQLSKEMSHVKIENSSKVIGWGASYYQYFEDLDKIETFADTPLQVKKKLFKEVKTDYGPELVEVNDQTPLEIGDRIISRIEVRVDRSMSYVHLKDMRPSGLEPENVLSGYRYQGGLGYYESTRDLASHFFISHLSKGTYVFEYPMRVVHRGDFSTGIATMQSMYAPEFNSHSEGVRIQVK